MTDFRLEERKKSFKKTSLNNTFKKHEAYALILRKRKKEEYLRDKRMKVDVPESKPNPSDLYLASFNEVFANPRSTHDERVKVAAEALCRPIDDEELIYGLVRCIRQAVSVDSNPPIGLVIKLGLPEKVMMMLKVDSERVRIEAAWVLTNVAAHSNESCDLLRTLGCPKALVALMNTSAPELTEQCMWAIGNIAGDSVAARDDVLATDIVPKIQEILAMEKVSRALLVQTYWTISSLFRGKPEPPAKQLKPLWKYLSTILDAKDDEISKEALWTWTYLTDSESFELESLASVFPWDKIASLISCEKFDIAYPSLLIVENVCANSDQLVDALINPPIVKSLSALISAQTDQRILKQCCIIAYNISVGPSRHISLLLDSGALRALCLLISSPSAGFDIKKDAVGTVVNSVMGGTEDMLGRMLEHDDVLMALVEALGMTDPKVLSEVVNAVDSLLSVGAVNSYNVFADHFGSFGGVDRLIPLQTHPNQSLSAKVNRVLDKYYYIKESPEEESAGDERKEEVGKKEEHKETEQAVKADK